MILTEGFRRLAAEVAELLTGLPGHRIEVVWAKPEGVNVMGLAHKSHDKFMVTIDPELKPAELLRVLLHELAHVRLHYDRLVIYPEYLLNQYALEIEGARIESGANELERFWLDQAERSGYDRSAYGILQALKKIYKPGRKGFYY